MSCHDSGCNRCYGDSFICRECAETDAKAAAESLAAANAEIASLIGTLAQIRLLAEAKSPDALDQIHSLAASKVFSPQSGEVPP